MALPRSEPTTPVPVRNRTLTVVAAVLTTVLLVGGVFAVRSWQTRRATRASATSSIVLDAKVAWSNDLLIVANTGIVPWRRCVFILNAADAGARN